MQNEQDLAVFTVEKLLLDYTEKLELARATDLARSKRYLEAQTLLSPGGIQPTNPKKLDLLARIAICRWRFNDAHRFWEASITVDPKNQKYRKCLNKLAACEANLKFWVQIFFWSLMLLIMLLLMGISVHSLLNRHRNQVSLFHSTDGQQNP